MCGCFYVSAYTYAYMCLSLTCVCASIRFFITHGLFQGGEIVAFSSLRGDPTSPQGNFLPNELYVMCICP